MSIYRNIRTTTCAALLGALLPSLASAATTPGTVALTGTISDYTGTTSTSSPSNHFSVAWVTDSTGKFIKTVWRQGPEFTSKEWGDHMPTYNNMRAGSTAIDGYTGATATNYTAAANNPVTTTWDCRDASGNIVPDGNYNFYIQYTESQSLNGVTVEGPVSSALTWTKGSSPSTINPPNQGTQGSPVNSNNFTNLSIVWTPATVAPTITSATPPATGSMGTAYPSHTFTATGSPKIRFVVTSGSLPTGITLTQDGLLSGTPTVAGTFTGTISADNGLTLANQPYSIAVAQAIVFTNTVPTNGNRTKPFNHSCSVIGTAPVTFSLGSGTLPPGLTLGSDGVISGIPTTLGTFTGKIKAQNGLAPDSLQDFSIVINPASEGLVTFFATISDYAGTTSTSAPADHYTAVWVTDAAGNFIKTLWKQGAGFTNKDWKDHLPTYNTARGSNTVIDGFTSATAKDYVSPNNPIVVTWNCRDANGNLVDDGNYKFWIQYSENQSGVPGPVTAGGLTWTKSQAPSTVIPPDQGTQGIVSGSNFTRMSITWMPTPDIAVYHSGNVEILDGGAMDFGSLEINTSGMAHEFSIKNYGSADLLIPAITAYGVDAANFIVTAPTSSKLAPGASATFSVAFRPGSVGASGASLQIASNDPDESPFEIQLTGKGTPPPAPEIAVMQPATSNLTSKMSKRNFGTVEAGSKKGKALTFTIKNTGNAPLTGLKIMKIGSDLKAFVVSDLSATTLAAGGSTTFKVTFKPSTKGSRHGGIRIVSNDADENPFEIIFAGQSVKPKK